MGARASTTAALVIAVVILGALPARAEVPFPKPGPADDPYDYASYAFVDDGSCEGGDNPGGARGLPSNFDCISDWKFTDQAARPGDPDFDALVAADPAELGGVKGAALNLAWEVTTGRPDVVIAVLDSGIRWDGVGSVGGAPDDGELGALAGLRRKLFLNRGELPRPGPRSCRHPGFGGYDRNCDGIYNVDDHDRARGCRTGCAADENGNALLDPQDLILTYSDGKDQDRNGYPDDISGWDFFENDNDPNDDVDYGHGTGEARDSTSEAGVDDEDGTCPNCMSMPLRVGDSFVADVNHFAEAVVYAVDNGALVVQEALGTLNNSSFGQEAVDYAYRNGVVVVASAADESAAHHNYPSNYEHTMVVNSITRYDDLGLPVSQTPKSYLYFNGCTNFGGKIHVAIPSSSCSSEATGRSAGYAGLLYSAALNAIDQGRMTPYITDDGRRAPYPLSAQEVMQLFRLGARDIDFSPPHSLLPWTTVHALPSRRYQTAPGWDMFFGYGRLDVARMLDAAGFRARAGEPGEIRIPPEADISSPRWFAPLPAEGEVALRGRVAANRSSSYTWRIEWAPGVQPGPAGDRWTEFGAGEGRRAYRGVLGRLDLAGVAAAVETYGPAVFDPVSDPTSPDLPERNAFRVRLIVTDAHGTQAVFQKQLFIAGDPDTLPGFPRDLGADGAGSGAFADLDGDGGDELVIATSDGEIHALDRRARDIPGWPARTDPLPLPARGDNAFRRGEVSTPVRGPVLLGSPAIADIVPGDAGALEVAVADLEGKVYVFEHSGRRAAGFPVSSYRRFSEEPGCEEVGPPRCDDFLGPLDRRDALNTVDHGFTANPAVADLDPETPGLELIVAGHDSHVYAWHADGTPVAGWPVLLRDPAKVRRVHPRTHKVTFASDDVLRGSKAIVGVSVGDLEGDGDLEVVAAVNEEYAEEPNASLLRDQLSPLLGELGDPGNGRVYALAGRGRRAAPGEGHRAAGAYLPGWPVALATIAAEVLPYVGEGPDGAPTLADIDGDGDLEVGVAMMAGPGYVLDHGGESVYGTGADGKPITLATLAAEYKSTARDPASYVALGGGVFAELLPGRWAWIAPAGGLIRLLDIVLSEQQLGAEDHVSAWDAQSGTFLPGFPALVNDLQFFVTPTVADVSGDGVPEVLEGSAVYDLRAVNALGRPPAGWPRFTGGWIVSSAATGDLDGDRLLDVAVATREGWLFVWSTDGDACQEPRWPKYQHDLANSGNASAPVELPSSCNAPQA